MPARLRLALVVATGCLVVALGAVVLFGGGGDGGGAASASPTGFNGALRPPEAAAPDFRLRDQDGALATMREYRGQDVVVTFLYSTCEDTCPLTAQQIRGALDKLDRDVPVIAVSVDPSGDTPFHVRRFLVQQRLDGRMRYVTGTREQLEPVWKAYGIQPQGEGFEHSASTVVVDGDGMQRIGFLTDQLTPEGLAQDLERLSAEQTS